MTGRSVPRRPDPGPQVADAVSIEKDTEADHQNAGANENVEFGLRMGGMGEKERCEHALHYFHLVGLAGFEDYLVVRLSGGMQ